jgi:hypothetical protein
MTPLLSYAPGWNLDVPAGTLVIRCDVVMNQRPGAGGYAAILEAADMMETILLRGGIPDGTTDDLVNLLVTRLAAEIRGNRAVILTRSPIIGTMLGKVFKQYRMIRMVLNMPLAVADATRHAAVMAERSEHLREFHEDRLLSARYAPCEEHSDNQDSGLVHAALQNLLKTVSGANLNKEEVQKASQNALDAVEAARVSRLRQTLRTNTANDIPKMTKLAKENRS